MDHDNYFAEDNIPCECGKVTCDGWCEDMLSVLNSDELLIATEIGVLN